MRHITNLFSHDRQAKKFTAFRSDLPGDLGRVYPDACDEGLILVSERTGKEATFVMDSIHRDADNDVQYWTLIPTRETLRKSPDLTGYQIILFND